MRTDTMKLKDKGPQKAPPVLKGPAQKVSLEVQSWPDVISVTHWTIGDSTKVNGADFYVGENELGHIHLDGEIHMPLSKPLRKLLIEKDLAEAFPWGDTWIQMTIKNEKTAALGAWLFQLGYDRINGTSDADLKARINERASS